MHENNFILKKGDVGFLEISKILKKFISGDKEPRITHIRTLNSGAGLSLMRTTEGPKWCNYYFELEIAFSNGQPVNGTFYDLEYQINKMYLGSNIFLINNIIFWFGALVSLISIFL
ncbi:MAG: hypothetical protein FJZ13_05560 [Candidatus Omnitrophica bacterium]|nr:hypothetical protein [Candidatus Omnitrophota bacterium]